MGFQLVGYVLYGIAGLAGRLLGGRGGLRRVGLRRAGHSAPHTCDIRCHCGRVQATGRQSAAEMGNVRCRECGEIHPQMFSFACRHETLARALTFIKYRSLGDDVDVHPENTIARQIRVPTERPKGRNFSARASIFKSGFRTPVAWYSTGLGERQV